MNGAGRLGDGPVLASKAAGGPVEGGVQRGGGAVVIMNGAVPVANGPVQPSEGGMGGGRGGAQQVGGAEVSVNGPVLSTKWRGCREK